MQKYLPILKKTRLFINLSDTEILSTLSCLNAKVKSFNKNATIFSDGDEASFVGIILLGDIETQKIDYDGYPNIISKLSQGDLIAASTCYSSEKRLPFDVISKLPSEILCLDINHLISPCCKACSFHTTITKNMLGMIADRNIQLANKIDILTKRTIREKLLTYLYEESKKAKNKKFSVPLTRRQMADYLSVDRSALSRELGNLQNEGILEFDKNFFHLI